MEHNGISKLDLKRRNRMQILKLLRQQGPTSRIDIAASLELTRAAVTIITNKMIDEDVIYERGEVIPTEKKATRGRRKILLDICENAQLVFGASIDNGRVTVGVTNIAGEIISKETVVQSETASKEEILDSIAALIQKLSADNSISFDQILGVGIGVSKAYYERLEVVVTNGAAEFYSIKGYLRCKIDLPIVVCEITEGLAIAQLDFLEKEKIDDMVFIRQSNQIETATIISSSIFTGQNGSVCDLKKLLESLVKMSVPSVQQFHFADTWGSETIHQQARAIFSQENTPHLFEALDGNYDNIATIPDLMSHLTQEKEMIKIMDQHIVAFATVLKMIESILNPQKIIVSDKYCQTKEQYDYVMQRVSELFEIKCPLWGYSEISEDKLFLAGSALAVRELLIDRGGL